MPSPDDKNKAELAKKAKDLAAQLAQNQKSVDEMMKLAAEDKKLKDMLQAMQKVLKAQHEATKKVIANMR